MSPPKRTSTVRAPKVKAIAKVEADTTLYGPLTPEQLAPKAPPAKASSVRDVPPASSDAAVKKVPPALITEDELQALCGAATEPSRTASEHRGGKGRGGGGGRSSRRKEQVRSARPKLRGGFGKSRSSGYKSRRDSDSDSENGVKISFRTTLMQPRSSESLRRRTTIRVVFDFLDPSTPIPNRMRLWQTHVEKKHLAHRRTESDLLGPRRWR